MSFLNATLLFAVASVAVPVLLHLISRREPKRVVFPSVRFLTKTYESNRTKLRVRRWWLLALRMAALAALAIALARPAIHQSLSITWLTIGLIGLVGLALLVLATVSMVRGFSKVLTFALVGIAVIALLSAISWGGYTYASGKPPAIDNASPAAVAIIVDNSATSGWKTPTDDRLARIKEIAKWMISRLPPTSRVAVIDRSSTPAAFAMDVGSAMSKVDQLQPLSITQNMASKIDAAARLVRTSDLESRRLLVITDLTQPTWNDSLADPQLPSVLSEEPKVALTVFDLGEFKGENRSLSMPRLSDLTPPQGVPVPISTTLHYDKSVSDDSRSITIEWEMYDTDPSLPVVRDGEVQRPNLRSVERLSLQLAPGESSEVVRAIPPMNVGVHHGVMRLVGEDALALDDVRHFTVEVLPPSRVLLVGDQVEEAIKIAGAITAPLAIDDPNTEYLVERISFDDLPAVRMDDFDAAILLNPPSEALGDEKLVAFVNQGGNVFACLGENAGSERIELEHLPVFLRPWRAPEPFSFLSPLQTSHPILAPMNEISGGVPWGDYRVEQYWQVETQPQDSVLMRYAGTKHAALFQRRGKKSSDDAEPGYWTILTTPIPDLVEPWWNDLFSGSDAWPAFVLFRQITESISGRASANWMPEVGQPQVIKLLTSSTEEERRRLQLFPPGDSLPVPMDVAANATQVAVSDVSQPGTYWLRGDQPGIGFSANLSRQATDVRRIDPSQLNVWFGAEGYQMATSRDEIEFAETESAQRVALRSPMMLCALAVFLLEMILSNLFYRSSRAAKNDQSGGQSQSVVAA